MTLNSLHPVLAGAFLGACAAPPAPPPAAYDAALFRRVFEATTTDEDLASWARILDDRAPHAGPQHEDLWRALTTDGLRFELDGAVRIREHAAVPEAVVGPDGRTRLLYVEGDFRRARAILRDRAPWSRFHGLIGFGAVDQIVSQDGTSFEQERAFVIAGIAPGMVVDPTILARPAGGWRLYYLGVGVDALVREGAWDDGVDHVVYSASSGDLVRWAYEGAVAVGPNADPAVWCDGDWCLMVSTGLDRSISQDGGRSFAFQGDFGVPGFAPAFVALPGGRLRLYYNAKERGGPLRSMISEDRGRSWVGEPGDRVPPYQLEAPSFVPRPEGGWWVYYHYWRDGLSGDSWRDGYAFNPDAPRRGPGGAMLPTPPPGQAPTVP
jgi:hypothetical protein